MKILCKFEVQDSKPLIYGVGHAWGHVWIHLEVIVVAVGINQMSREYESVPVVNSSIEQKEKYVRNTERGGELVFLSN